MNRDTRGEVRLALGVFACGVLACHPAAPDSAGGDVDLPGGVALSGRTETQDSVVESARRALTAGHPWTATTLLAPVLTDPRRRTPDAILLAARAAAGWGGWSEVDRLLSTETWIDSGADGEGRELLARSALEQDHTAQAVADGGAALTAARTNEERAVRSVVLARALDRSKAVDSAAALYLVAANGLAPIGDWLMLRSAGARASAADRTPLYARVRSTAAKPRIAWTEAQALERFGNPLGAADRYAALGDQLSALRLRLVGSRDSASREHAKNDLIVFLRSHGGTDGRQGLAVLDAAFPILSDRDELDVARAIAGIVPARAVSGFERSLKVGALSPDDRLQYALALSRVGRSPEAIAILAAIRAPAPIAAQAEYQRARLVLAASGAVARPVLRQLADSFPADTADGDGRALSAGRSLYGRRG